MVKIEVKTAKIVVETIFFKVTDNTTLKLVPPEISRSYNNKETQCSFKRNLKTFHILSSIAMMLNIQMFSTRRLVRVGFSTELVYLSSVRYSRFTSQTLWGNSDWTLSVACIVIDPLSVRIMNIPHGFLSG